MRAQINTFALQTEKLQSAALGPLAVVAHPVDIEGRYLITVCQESIVAGRCYAEVRKEWETVQQADLDLAPFGTPMPEPHPGLKLGVGGYLMFFVSTGPGGFHMLVDRVPEDDTSKSTRVFDSRALGSGDLFIVTLIRPGKWRMQGPGGVAGSITVAYPSLGKIPYQTPEAEYVDLKQSGFDPKAVKIGPAQGIVYRIHVAKAAIVVDLVEPDNGPSPSTVFRRVRWNNPAQTPTSDAKDRKGKAGKRA